MDAENRDPIAEGEAYAALGRLLVTWSLIDQCITRALCRRDRSSPFPPPVSSAFPARWQDWRAEAQSRWPTEADMSWDEFERQQAEALPIRNALAHWVIDVEGHEGRFSVAVHPYEPGGWRPAFDRWWRRVQHMPPMQRHPGPANGRVTRWWDWHLKEMQQRWEALLVLTVALDSGEMGATHEAIAVLTRPNHTALTP
ncbi:hypothetical protein D3C72_522160 [compost metagenome]